MRLAFLMTALMCILAHGAAAQTAPPTASVGAAQIVLPPPAGFCPLDGSRSTDASLKQAATAMIATSGTNLLLAQHVDCAQLEQMRAGKRRLLDDFVQYQTLTAWMDKDLPVAPAAVISETCSELRKSGGTLATQAVEAVNPKLQAFSKSIRINEMRFLGVVAEDPATCYAALMQKLRTDDGGEKTQLCIFSTSVVRGKIVYFYVYTPYATDLKIETVLERHKAATAAFQRANG